MATRHFHIKPQNGGYSVLEKVSGRWDTLSHHQGAGEAISWLCAYRRGNVSLKPEQEQMILPQMGQGSAASTISAPSATSPAAPVTLEPASSKSETLSRMSPCEEATSLAMSAAASFQGASAEKMSSKGLLVLGSLINKPASTIHADCNDVDPLMGR